MASKSGLEATRLDFYARLHAQPYAYDFYQALRRCEALHPEMPRIGDALRPSEEPIRITQEASLTFAPANLAGFYSSSTGPSWLAVRFLGLFGPQGAMPTHITELARERLRHHNDPTLTRFADLFHHRLLSAFYKAWRQAQPTVNQDRPEQDSFARYVCASFGAAQKAEEPRDQLDSQAKRFFCGHLSRGARNADGLTAILGAYFKVPVALQPFHAQWMALPDNQRSALCAAKNNQLGRSMVLGKKVWDAQHHIGVRIGPLTLMQYQNLLPGQAGMVKLADWIKLYTDRQFFWKADLVLKKEEVPPLRLNGSSRLGWTTWLHKKARLDGAQGVRLDETHAVARIRAAAIESPL